jgi:hypothetical protein
MNRSSESILIGEIRTAVERTFATAVPEYEEDFQLALARELGECQRELLMTFSPPRHVAQRPPPLAISYCASRGKTLSFEGRDPCSGSRRKLDILWLRQGRRVALELKFVRQWKSDVYGYEVLRDLHRLERLVSARCGNVVHHLGAETERFAVFATRVGDYFEEGPSKEPAPFRIHHGRNTKAAYWVQYDQPSHRTRWYDYPPFFLANAYSFTWTTLANAEWRLLIVHVPSQVEG